MIKHFNKKHIIYSAFILISIIALIIINKNFLKKPYNGLLKDKNIFLITLDTLRADYVSAYGENKANTPNLDKIASEGILFSKCISQTPITLPSHTTILSGTYPLYNNVRDNSGSFVPQELEFVSELLQEKGYETSAFIASYVLHSKWGISQGFDLYSDNFEFDDHSSLGKTQLRADKVLERAKEWIKKNKKKKFFSWIHLYDPHVPYDAPSPYSERRKDDPYAGEVEYMDAKLGEFFDFLKKQGIYKDSIIIITGDHGEALGDHGEKTHAYFIYDKVSHVPLIIKMPYNFPIKKVNGFVELVDLAPTILQTQEIKNPDSYQGESLIDLMMGNVKKRKKHYAYTESYYPRINFGWSELKGFYFDKKYKYIIAPKEELYDLENDKNENNNIFNSNSKIVRKRKLFFRNFLKNKSKNAIAITENKSLTQSDKDKLKSLGYLSSNIDISKKTNLADPKDKFQLYTKIINTSSIISKLGKNKTFINKDVEYDKAINTLKNIIDRDKNIVYSYVYIGHAYKNKKMYHKALKYYYKALKKKPQLTNIKIDIINMFIQLKEYHKALNEINIFLKISPEDNNLINLKGKIYLALNDMDSALKTYKKSLISKKNNSMALKEIGRILLLKKDFNKAKLYLDKAEEINPKLKDLCFLKAQLYDKTGNKDKVIEYYKKEIKNDKTSLKSHLNLGLLYQGSGNSQEAIKHFKNIIIMAPEYKMGYFLLSMEYLKIKKSINNAIELCKIGISIKPEDKYTAKGYILLSHLYALKKKMNISQSYYDKGIELEEKYNK